MLQPVIQIILKPRHAPKIAGSPEFIRVISPFMKGVLVLSLNAAFLWDLDCLFLFLLERNVEAAALS